MRPVLYDTSIYVAALRGGDGAILDARRVAGNPVWLSAVVLEELYAGANERSRKLVQALERDFMRTRRMLVPNAGDWAQAGRVLARLGAMYGYEEIGRGRLTNDALIATTAARAGMTVITANSKDFARLAEFRNFHWMLVTA